MSEIAISKSYQFVGLFLVSHFRISQMKNLKDLNVSQNRIKQIPDGIGSLNCLSVLDISHNTSLMRLTSFLTSLSLERFICANCYNLNEPPYAVCQGGFSEIKQYYKDLDDGKDSMTLSTVVLIGRKEVGKSTLLNIMKRGFKPHKSDNRPIEKTRVFDVQRLLIETGDFPPYTVNVIDFGGDEVYHYAYQLTFRKDCVPLVVVNMVEYESLSVHFGRREATRRVAFDWLSHMLTAAHEIQTPILVFTHRDEYSDTAKFHNLVQGFLTSMSELTEELSIDITDLKSKVGSSELFDPNMIIVIGFDCPENELVKLKNHLLDCIRKSKCSIPLLWTRIVDNITQKNIPQDDKDGYRSFLDLRRCYEKPRLSAILGFLQRAGQILRYEQKAGHLQGNSASLLDDAIFHNIEAVKQVIASLYNHSMTSGIQIQEKEIGIAPVNQKHNSYLCNGILYEDILRKRIEGEHEEQDPKKRKEHFKTFVALLTKFKLLYGPTVVNGQPSCYLLPYFMPEHNFQLPVSDVHLQAIMHFVGLNVPSYAFHQMTVAVIQHFSGEYEQIFPYGNGASVKLNSSDTHVHLIHQRDAQSVEICIQTGVPAIYKAWNVFIRLLNVISTEVKSVWPATRIIHRIPCPHCVILKRPNPANLDIHSLEQFHLTLTTMCGVETDVPALLRGPCKQTQ